MKGSIYIAKVAGIKIFIHWTFFILIVWIIGSGLRKGDNTEQILYSTAFILTIFLCVVLHELGHALMAKRFNFRTKDIILLPIGGMARMEEIPENPKQELLVAIAGPAVNVVIAGILYPFINFSEYMAETERLVPGSDNFLFLLFTVNLLLAIFNLVPAFPMDGGRIFRAILSLRMDRVKATVIAAYTGQAIAFLFFILGIFYNPFLVLIAVFIYITAGAEREYVKSRFVLQSYKVKDLVSQDFHQMKQTDTLKDAAKLLLNVQSTSFIITEGEKIVGILNRDGIIKCLAEKGENATVAEAMETNIKFTREDVPLNDAFKEFQTTKTTIMPVMKGQTLLGVLDMNDVMELIMVKTATDVYSSRFKEA